MEHSPSKNVTAGSRTGLGGDGRLPVRLVDEDGSEVTNNVDNSKHQTIGRKHGQVRSFVVSGNRSASISSSLVESTFNSCIGGENDLAFFLRIADSLVKEVVDQVRGVNLDVDNENHENQNGKDDDSVNVTGQESSLKTSRRSVQDDTPGDKERSQTVIHPGKSFDSGSTTEQKHRSHDSVGSKTKEQESLVGIASPTGVDNLAHSVGRRCNLLKGDCDHTEQENLNGGTSGVPRI